MSLLEQVVRLTGPPEDQDNDVSTTIRSARLPEGAASQALFEHTVAMEDAFVHAIVSVSSQLDPRDFRLGPPLAMGSARASLEILRAFRNRFSGASALLDSTMRSVAMSTVSMQAVELKDSKRIEWTEHQFALHVLRLHVQKEATTACAAGTARKPPSPPDTLLIGAELDDEATLGSCVGVGGEMEGSDAMLGSEAAGLAEDEDIAEVICDTIPDTSLAHLADFAVHMETHAIPPILAAMMVRAWLLVRKEDRADALFQAIFPTSPKVRTMVVEGEISAAFLRGVQRHQAASTTLRRMLARYEIVGPQRVCELLDGLLFDGLIEEEHAYHVILKHQLTKHLILWMRSGGLKGGSAIGAAGFCGAITATTEAMNLRVVGERLFQVAFTVHGGFLPQDPQNGNNHCDEACPWDTGALDLSLLALAPATEDSLQLVRQVLLRCVRRRHAVGAGSIAMLAEDWLLGRWTLCRDPVVIGEAFALLTNSWRAIAGLPGLGDMSDQGLSASEAAIITPSERTPEGVPLVGKGSRRVAEELLMKMLSDLEVWRLPQRELLTPWVPGHILACHVAAQCQQLEERQASLVEETRENVNEIARLQRVMTQLSGKLEKIDVRSQICMQRQADLNDTLRQLR